MTPRDMQQQGPQGHHGQPQSPPRCMRCGGVHLTPPTATATDLGESTRLVFAHLDGGIFDQGIRLYCEAQACLDCGYVSFALSPSALQEARSQSAFRPWNK